MIHRTHDESPPSRTTSRSPLRDEVPRTSQERRDEEDILETVAAAARHGREILEQATLYVRNRADRTKIAFRDALFGLVSGVLAGIVALILLVSGSLFLLRGIAHGVSEALGTGPWAGEIAAGLLGVGGVIGGFKLLVWRIRRRNLEKLREKYEDSEPEAAAETNGRHRELGSIRP